MVQIIAESASSKAKMNEMDGSYLLHELGKCVVSKIETPMCLGQMIEEINLCRYNLNKSRIESIFGGDGRYLRLLRNEIGDDKKVEKRKRITISRRSNKHNQSRLFAVDASNSPKSTRHFLHIPVERGAHIANISVFGSDTTMSAAKRNRFVRRKKRIMNKESGKYKAIEMKEIDEDEKEESMEVSLAETTNTIQSTESEDTLRDVISQNVLAVSCSDTDTDSYDSANAELSFGRSPKEGYEQKRHLSIQL